METKTTWYNLVVWDLRDHGVLLALVPKGGGFLGTQPQKTTFPMDFFTKTLAIDRVHQHNPISGKNENQLYRFKRLFSNTRVTSRHVTFRHVDIFLKVTNKSYGFSSRFRLVFPGVFPHRTRHYPRPTVKWLDESPIGQAWDVLRTRLHTAEYTTHLIWLCNSQWMNYARARH